jgi:hypothetical protein
MAVPGPLAVLVAEVAAGVEGTPVVEDVPVPDMFFEHPAADTVTIPAMAMTNPDFTTETRAVIWLSPSIARNHAAGAVDRWDTS